MTGAGEGVPDGGAAPHPDEVAGMLGVRALGLARLASVPAGIALGLRSADVSWVAAIGNSLFAVLWILATNRLMSRRGLGARSTLIVGAVDVAVVVTGLAVTGGVDSDMVLLLGVLPLAAAFEFRASVVAAIGASGALVITVLGRGDPGDLAAILVVLAWSTGAGLALARDRRALLGRVGGLATAADRLLGAHERAGARERERAVDDLREGGLRDVRAARAALTEPDGAAAAARHCRAAVDQLRGLVSELHALSARPIALRAALHALAARRSGERARPVEVQIEEGAQGRRDDLVLVLVRDLLDALAHAPADDHVRVAVRVRDDGLEVRVAVDAVGASPRFDALLVAQVRERLAGLPGARLVAGPRHVVAVLPDAAAPGAARPHRTPTIRTLLTARLTGGVAVLALAGIGGTDSAWFWGLSAGGFVLLLVSTVRLAGTALSRRALIAGAVLDQGAALAALALAGPAQDELLPLFVGFVPIYACLFGPGVVLAVVVVLGVGTTAIVGAETNFLIAYAWAGAVALVLADAASTASRIIGAQLDRRRAAFLSLLASEEAARRVLARRLHDDALQFLLAARQDVEEAGAGGPAGAEARARAEASLGEVETLLTGASLREDVDPPPAGGLAAALEQLAREAEGDGSPAISRHVAPGAAGGPDDGLLLGVARELVTNAVRHADAEEITIALEPVADGVRLVVADDGRGIAPGREQEALAEGHIGLAAARDRVRRRGGTLAIAAAAGGTTVTVELPGR